MKVSCWKGGTYGIRINYTDRSTHFQKKWKDVVVQAGGKTSTYKLTTSFWTKCPELRGKAIKDYLVVQGLSSWPKGKPPALTLSPTGGNSFTLI